MAIHVRRSNNQNCSFHDTIEPALAGGDLYLGWSVGGLYRATYWSLRIEPNSFERVIATMLDADYERTVLAFADALTKREPRRNDS